MRLHPLLLLVLVLLGAVPLRGVTPHLVKDINPIPRGESSSPGDFVAAGGLAYFTASDGETGFELWRSDGTLPGTFQLTDACPGQCSSGPRFVANSDRLYFFLAAGPLGEDLWVTAGS